MAADVSDRLGSMEDIVALIDGGTNAKQSGLIERGRQPRRPLLF
jgi:hypothetical protein